MKHDVLLGYMFEVNRVLIQAYEVCFVLQVILANIFVVTRDIWQSMDTLLKSSGENLLSKCLTGHCNQGRVFCDEMTVQGFGLFLTAFVCESVKVEVLLSFAQLCQRFRVRLQIIYVQYNTYRQLYTHIKESTHKSTKISVFLTHTETCLHSLAVSYASTHKKMCQLND